MKGGNTVSDGGQEAGWEGVLGDGEGVRGRGGDGVYVEMND
jgi:hypothetical protein